MDKTIKIKDLLKKLNKLSDEELEQELVVSSDSLGVSGCVVSIKKRKKSLYTNNDEDFYTHTELVRDKGELSSDIKKHYTEYFKKGDLYLGF